MKKVLGSMAALALAAGTGCGDPCLEPGVACTWAGGLDPGFDGDGNPLRESRMYAPIDLTFGPDGTPWVLDWNNHKIRRVTKDGTFETVVGEFLGDGDPDMLDLTPEGAPGLTVRLNHPTDLLFRPDGTILFAAWHNHKLRELDPATGIVHVTCGLEPGFAGDGHSVDKARFSQPKSIVLTDDGVLYILDQRNQRIRRIVDDVVSTVVGNGEQGFNGDDHALLETQLNFEAGGNPEPSGALALDAEERLYIADSLNHRIRRVDFEAGTIETIAGTGEAGYAGDGGPATGAKLNNPRDLELGPDGRLWIADTENHVVRALDLATGVIETVVGSGKAERGEDEAPAREISFRRPFGIAFDGEGDLYVSDSYNHRIVRVER